MNDTGCVVFIDKYPGCLKFSTYEEGKKMVILFHTGRNSCKTPFTPLAIKLYLHDRQTRSAHEKRNDDRKRYKTVLLILFFYCMYI